MFLVYFNFIQDAFNRMEKYIDLQEGETLHNTETLDRMMETWIEVQMDGSSDGSGGEGSGDPDVTTQPPGNMAFLGNLR